MPSFADELSSEQIVAVIAYMRTLCLSTRYPRGELNLPRPLVTEKAFPESESIQTVAIATDKAPDIDSEFCTSGGCSARNQLEVAIPYASLVNDTGTRVGGIGDVAVGLKRVLFASHNSIVSGFARNRSADRKQRQGTGQRHDDVRLPRDGRTRPAWLGVRPGASRHRSTDRRPNSRHERCSGESTPERAFAKSAASAARGRR